MGIESEKERKKELIVSIIHNNYMVRDGGTEKFAAGISKMIQNKGYSHLCFFPFRENKSITGKEIIGILYNDKFIGIADFDKMEMIIIDFLKKYDLSFNCFHVQHLKFHNLDNVLNTIKSFEVKVFLFAHDFFLVCNSQHFINSDGVFCGVEEPSDIKCINCNYIKEAINHHKKIDDFLQQIQDRIGSIICPSEYVSKVLKRNFPFLLEKIIVRPHLVFDEKVKGLDTIDALRFAFVGKRKMEKGYNQWQYILKSLRESNVKEYKYYYLGTNIENERDIENVYVSVAEQGSDAMSSAIASHNINCALLWAQCPETYSFVYYELMMSGVYIITNTKSGNIYDEVKKNKNGKAFESIEECLAWLNNPDLVLKEIREYRSKQSVPASYKANPEIATCISEKSISINNLYKSPNYLHPMLSLLYRLKYRV